MVGTLGGRILFQPAPKGPVSPAAHDARTWCRLMLGGSGTDAGMPDGWEGGASSANAGTLSKLPCRLLSRG